jgi:hypothetical protein
MELLLENDYVRLSVDRSRRLVRYQRSATPFESVAAYDQMIDQLLGALATVERHEYAILCDLRSGPLRSGDEFEPSALRFRRDVFRDFGRSAVLVRTQVGRLQVARHEKVQGPGPLVFSDEDAALSYLGSA